MAALIKKDFIINGWGPYIGMAIFITVSYMMTLPPTFIFILSFFALAFSVFSYDDKGQVNYFLVSLPVPKKQIVKSRYTFILLTSLVVLTFQFVSIQIVHPFLNSHLYVYSWKDLIVLFCVGAWIIAVCTPMIYFFRSIVMTFSIIITLFGIGTFFLLEQFSTVLSFEDGIMFNELDIGFILLAEKYFPWQPYVLLLFTTAIAVLLSMLLSIRLMNKKDM